MSIWLFLVVAFMINVATGRLITTGQYSRSLFASDENEFLTMSYSQKKSYLKDFLSALVLFWGLFIASLTMFGLAGLFAFPVQILGFSLGGNPAAKEYE